MFTDSIENLIKTTATNGSTQADAQKAAGAVLRALETASLPEVQTGLAQLGQAIENQNMTRAGFLAVVAGAIIENGHDCQPVVEPIVGLTKMLLELSEGAHDAALKSEPKLVAEAADDDAEEDEEEQDLHQLFETTLDGLRESIPEQFDAWYTFEMAWNPAIVILSKSSAARSAAKPLQPIAAKLSGYSEGGHWINLILNVLVDEPLIVLEPSTKLGIRGKMTGVVDNFQLSMLLMDQFPQKGILKKKRISKAAANCVRGEGPQSIDETITAPWDLLAFTAVQSDLSLSAETEHWIWNEGTPSDVPVFDGHRVILIAPPTYPRSFGAQRTFAKLPAKIEVEQTYSKAEVESLLKKMGT